VRNAVQNTRDAADRHAARRYGNQVQRAVAGVELQLTALSPRDRVIILNAALREALDEWQRTDRLRCLAGS
jgi:hypothetical protein